MNIHIYIYIYICNNNPVGLAPPDPRPLRITMNMCPAEYSEDRFYTPPPSRGGGL